MVSYLKGSDTVDSYCHLLMYNEIDTMFLEEQTADLRWVKEKHVDLEKPDKGHCKTVRY